MISPLCRPVHRLIYAARREGAERDGREGKGKGTTECRTARYQEIGKEIVAAMVDARRQDTTAG